jgi:hypothetical protein
MKVVNFYLFVHKKKRKNGDFSGDFSGPIETVVSFRYVYSS